jgi:hypothetical protein
MIGELPVRPRVPYVKDSAGFQSQWIASWEFMRQTG